jgi:predicted RNA-binding protein with PUA-like domain
MTMAYWLMKSEPDELSIDDLAGAPDQLFCWDGVRNYRARNWLAAMNDGDRFFFAHSSCKVPGIAGVAEIVGDAKPDADRWISRDVRFVERFTEILSLRELREHTEAFGHFHLLQRANRLSVMPVSEQQWKLVLDLSADRRGQTIEPDRPQSGNRSHP